MPDLTKYIVGVKSKNTEELMFQPGAMDKADETCVILMIPRSEFEKLQEQ